MSFAFILASIFIFFNSLYFIIEFYGIINDLTRNEIYHNDRYKYLYKSAVDKKGQVVMRKIGLLEKGVIANVKKFYDRNFCHLSIKE